MARDGSGSGSDTNGGRARRAGVRRRAFLKATGAGAAGVALAGCTTNPDDSTPSGDGGDGGDGDGGGDGGNGTTMGDSGSSLPDTINIGILAPAPSDNAIGASIANAAKLAAKHLNEEGGIGGQAQVDVSVKDTKEDPATGRTKYQEFTVGDDPVHLTAGIFTSEVLLNVLDDIADAGIPHMTTGAATPAASAKVNEEYDRYKYHFRTGPVNAHHLGQNLVDFLDAKGDDLGWESVAVLVEDYEWTNPVSAVLDDQLSDTGVEIAMSERYASGTENFGPIYDRVEESGADAAFIAMAHTGNPAIVQWAKQQRPFEFGGIHVPMQLPAYFDLVQGACRYGVTQNSATPQSAVTEKTIPFSDAYNGEYDSYPVYTGYITYDAIRQFATVVEEAGSVAPDDVVTGLEGSSYTGTAGTIEYYPPDNEFAHDVVYGEDTVFPLYQQWQVDDEGNGVQEVIWPDDLATAEYKKPPWV